MGKMLDIRDVSIIDALPVYDCPKIIFTVGAGHGRIEYYLSEELNYRVIASDIERNVFWRSSETLKFLKYNIFQYDQTITAPIVICSQVLEHLENYQTAFKNLIKHATVRLIVTFPYLYAFHSPDHINFWDDKTVLTFKKLALPYATSITKIRTKPEDRDGDKWIYLIIVDKRQKYA